LQPTLDTGKKYNDEERINSVDASYESLYGKIVSSWKSQDGKLASYHTQIPANTTATLYLPIEDIALDQVPSAAGVTFKGMTEHNGQKTAEFTLESGSYDFKAGDGKLTVNGAEGNPGDNPGGNPGDNPGGNPGDNPGTQEKISLTDCQIGTIPTQYYDKKKKEPAVSVTYKGKALVKGKDYTVAYQNNTNIGTAKAVLTGTGSYKGTAEKNFAIAVKKNASYTVGNYKYKIVNAKTDGKGTVKVTGVKSKAVKKKLKKISIAAKVNIGGRQFAVTAIEKNAFKDCVKATAADVKANVASIGSKAFSNCKKLKKIVIRSTKLKTVGKNAFQKINAKAVIQVPKAKLKTYKKKLSKKGQKKTVKISVLKK